MRSGVLAVVLVWSGVAGAQPAPTYPPPGPYQPAPGTYPGPPMTGYPGPPPAPPAPEPPPSRWIWSFGLGLATLAFDDMNGPCPSCEHGNIAAGIAVSAGYRFLPELAVFVLLDVGLASTDGLGSDGNGDGGKLEAVSFYGGAELGIADRLRLFGGLGVGKLGYSWEETSSDFLFGSSTQDFEMSIGSGPAALVGARFELGRAGKFGYGIEGRLNVVRMPDVGEASMLTVGFVGGAL